MAIHYKIVLILIALGLLATISLGSCKLIKNKFKKDMSKKYEWSPSMGAPKFYPVRVDRAYMLYGEDKARIIPSGGMLNNRLGTGAGGRMALGPDRLFEAPTGVEVVWWSLVEDQTYEASFELPAKTIEKHLAESYGTHTFTGGREVVLYYDEVNVTLLPGGRILVYLSGGGRRIELDTIYQAKKIAPLPVRKWFPDSSIESIQDYIDLTWKHEPHLLEHLQANGIPHELWDRYRKRYNYDIVFEFEKAEETVLNEGGVYHFINGELYRTEQYFPITFKATPKNIYRGWRVGDTRYSGRFYLQEKDIIEAFDRIDSDTRAELVIKVCKYNNLFDIVLRTEKEEIEIENTQIEVFKDGELIYWNYRGEERTKFIAE